MINFDLIQARIYVGSAPHSQEDVARLKHLKVSTVISLQSDQDMSVRNIDWNHLQTLYHNSSIAIQRFPIADFDEIDLTDKLPQPIQALTQLLDNGGTVYVHCNSGVCRGPAVVLGYLCYREGMSIEAGLRQIRISRPIASPFTGAVRKALIELRDAPTT